MKLPLSIILIALLLGSCTKSNYNPEINQNELQITVNKLSSELFSGRLAGTEENEKAAQYIAYHLLRTDLNTFGDDYFQNFYVNQGYEVSDSNKFSINNNVLKQHADYIPFGFSAVGNQKNEVLFKGYGLSESKRTKWNDYSEKISSKWVMILSGVPAPFSSRERFYSDRDKAMVAIENGASGVIIISKNDELANLEVNSNELSIPVLQITRSKAKELFKLQEINLDSLIERNQTKPSHEEIVFNAEAQIQISPKQVKMQNVYGYIEGSHPTLKEEYIIIGAHYDHLGMGGMNVSSRMPDTTAIHAGADDNASGVAAVLEIAQKIQSLDKKPERSIVFALFDGEEKGLLGSKYMAENLPIDTSKVKAMINFDMVGRLKPDSALIIGGYGTAKESKDLLEALNTNYGFNMTLSKEGYGPSDHAAFYAINIPVFYITTGAHDDYHTPFDLPDSINYAGLEYVTNFSYDLITKISNGKALTYQEAGPKENAGRHSSRFKVTLGIMPDFYGTEKRGLRVDLVVEGKPAYLGGMKKGDIILDFNGQKVGGIEDYMYWLKKMEPGQRILVKVLRNEEEKILTIQL